MLLAAWCGLRRGQVLRLCHEDVDLAAGVVMVRRNRVELLETPAAFDADPKTDAGKRTVAVPPHVLPVLAEHMATWAGAVPSAARGDVLPQRRRHAAAAQRRGQGRCPTPRRRGLGISQSEVAARLDVIALGVWLHGGDVRAALGEPLAYASEGFDDACVLLGDWTRRKAVPLVEACLPGASIRLGISRPGRPQATLRTGPATLMRLLAGRPAEPADYQLTAAIAEELVVF